MSLLPKSHKEFSKKEYWDLFFKKRGTKAFEWYGEYEDLSDILHKYIKLQDQILITGCGNSTLGRTLYDLGYSKVTNIDISPVVIRQMQNHTSKDKPGLEYLQMDATATPFPDASYSVVLDKGTLDALMPDDTPATLTKITDYFKEVERLLRLGGRYICVSLLQEHILRKLLDFFPAANFMFRAVRCFHAEKSENTLPVYVVICTKTKALPMRILELVQTTGDKAVRVQTTDEIVDAILAAQHAAFVCSSLNRSSITVNDEVSFDLYSPGGATPRYTITLLDGTPKQKNYQYAAFIVPHGRHAEWIFGTREGHLQMLSMLGTSRLAVVTMHRNQVYGTFDEIRLELNEAVLKFAPADLSQEVPVATVGNDVGERTTRFEGHSEFSGDFLVEDVDVAGVTTRRLYYLSNQMLIQSEVRLKGKACDLKSLRCGHHKFMSVAAKLACVGEGAEVAVIGLGGGGLCSFLRLFVPGCRITGVDIDRAMLQVATDWFGLQLDGRLRAVIQDGVEFLEGSGPLAAVLFDVDSKDSSMGMSCPPQRFLDDDVLERVCAVLGDAGYFVLNLVVRDLTLRPAILDKLKSKFRTIVSYKMETELGEIFICRVGSYGGLREDFVNAAKEFNEFLAVGDYDKEDGAELGAIELEELPTRLVEVNPT